MPGAIGYSRFRSPEEVADAVVGLSIESAFAFAGEANRMAAARAVPIKRIKDIYFDILFPSCPA
jgi:hypothetical protein